MVKVLGTGGRPAWPVGSGAWGRSETAARRLRFCVSQRPRSAGSPAAGAGAVARMLPWVSQPKLLQAATHFRYLAMTSGVMAAQMGVELRVIRVGSTVLRTFGVVDLCVRTSERSHGLAGRLLAEVTELARSCGSTLSSSSQMTTVYTRGGWARAANPCSWGKIPDHTKLGLATAEDTGPLMGKRIGQRGWPIGEGGLLGHLFWR